MTCYFIYCTCANDAEADRIGRAIVQDRLAACVNILGPAKSIYWWQGKVDAANEIVLVAKTAEDRLEALIACIRALHSYETPCVVATKIEAGNPDFLDWIAAETRGPIDIPISCIGDQKTGFDE